MLCLPRWSPRSKVAVLCRLSSSDFTAVPGGRRCETSGGSGPRLTRKRVVNLKLSQKLMIPKAKPEIYAEHCGDISLTLVSLNLNRSRNDHKMESRHHFNSLLISYFEACEAVGDMKPAIDFYRLIPTSLKNTGVVRADDASNDILRQDVVDMSAYHVMLKTIAGSGNLHYFQTILDCMKKDGKALDPQCFVSCFVLAGVVEDKQIAEPFAVKIFKQMSKMGFKPEELTRDCIFYGDEKEKMARGLKLVDVTPKEPEIRRIFTKYDNVLLNDLEDRSSSAITSLLTPTLKHKRQDFDELLERQVSMEKSGFLKIPSICAGTVDKNKCQKITEITDILRAHWRSKIVEGLKFRIERLEKKYKFSKDAVTQSSPLPHYFLQAVDIDEFTDTVLGEVENLLCLSEGYSPRTKVLQRQLGTAVVQRLRLKRKMSDGYMNKYLKCLKDYYDWFLDPKDYWSPREAYLNALERNQEGPTLHTNPVDWPYAVVMVMGREIFNIIINHILVKTDTRGRLIIGDKVVHVSPDNQVVISGANPAHSVTTSPAFYQIYRSKKLRSAVEEVKPHPMLSKLYTLKGNHEIKFSVTEMPMLIPPLPRINNYTGGYLFYYTDIVRAFVVGTSLWNHRTLKEKMKDVTPVFDCLNLLGSTAWKVNKDVLEVIVEVFTKQQKYGDCLTTLRIPRHSSVLTPPTLNEDVRKKMADKDSLNVKEMAMYKEFVAERQAFNQFKGECYSQWCDAVYRLSLADHFKDDILFFPHNIDFRGRVYPLPPHLNHMGGDITRSLLVFAEPKPLGPNGLKWLKLHVINLTGEKKKESVAERLVYADEVMEDILDSANNPLTGKRWWMDSDDPFQTLATCFEIRNAMNLPNPEEYLCHLPVHQDGSCNGLQHYAALGRDVLGAKSVNLVPSDRPQDVYMEIANIVERKRNEDAQKGLEIARVLEGFISRKVVKQTVMTTVYGVTEYGAKLQIARKLEDVVEFPPASIDAASRYLARKIFESLNEIFEASQDIQAWFNECANQISGHLLRTIEWRTPLGLPVVQPYMKQTSKGSSMESRLDINTLVRGSYEKGNIYFMEKPNLGKQKNGFPPNFIHSLDSSHMMLTALYLWNKGITFASVHDCYWTHACDVEIMNKITRDQFISLHSQPILEDLGQFFIESFLQDSSGLTDVETKKAEMLFKSVPPKGTLDLNVVKDSIYFFS